MEFVVAVVDDSVIVEKYRACLEEIREARKL